MENPHKKIKAYWQGKSHYDKFVIVGSIIFLSVAAFFIVAHRVFFTPDQFYALGFIFALITGQASAFLWDWTPLLLLILSYEYLRGLIPLVNHHVHFNLMWKFDLLIFGHLPTVVLQQWFFNANHIHWYDYVATSLYLMHYVVCLIVGYFFWETDRKYFKEYVTALVALCYLTFLTYLIFPAAPPWIATLQGNIPPLQHVTTIVLSHMFNYVAVPSVYGWFGSNVYAAVPSLHAAFPMLIALFVGKKWPKLWPILAIYILSVWVAVIYLGEHYVFDVLLGAIYALVVYSLVYRAKACLLKKRRMQAAQ